MSINSKIEWTQNTWNPVTGCSKISDGCLNCYAYTLSKRLKAMHNPRYNNGFNVTLHKDLIELPLSWKKPSKIFVNSMSDLFHESIPDDFIFAVFNTMNKAHWHNFQILTKRSERLMRIADKLKWTDNIWQGVTVESQDFLYRIDHLRQVPCKLRFISFEPLLSQISNANLDGIDWVIVGGESGTNPRPIEESWVLNIQEMCSNDNIPFFFKQWGGKNKRKNGCLLQGQEYHDYPK